MFVIHEVDNMKGTKWVWWSFWGGVCFRGGYCSISFSICNLVDDVSVFVVFCFVPRVTVKLEESFRVAELLGEKVGLILSLI